MWGHLSTLLTMRLCRLLCQFEADEADFDDVAGSGGESFTSWLVIDVGAIHAANVTNVPGAMTIFDIRMSARDEVVGQANSTGRRASDGCFGFEIKACAW